MTTVRIPHTDLVVGALSLGTADLGLKNSEEEAHALLDYFADSGGNLIDTARVYSDWIPGEIGRSERIIGDWMSQAKNRERVLISTKGAHPNLKTMNIPRVTPEDILEDVEKSRDALRVDTIDLYYLHRDDTGTPIPEIIDVLDTCVRNNTVRYAGCSNWGAERLKAAVGYSNHTGKTRFVANQVLWNIGSAAMKPKTDLTIVAMDQDLLATCRETETAVVTFSSFAGGYFSKVTSGDADEVNKATSSAYHTERNGDVVTFLEEDAREKGRTIPEMVLGYLLNRDQPLVAVIGPKSIQQLEICLTSCDAKLGEGWLEKVDRMNGFTK